MQAFSVQQSHPFLVARFDAPQDMLSWSLTRPGFVTAGSVAWLQVDDDDLTIDVDPVALLRRRMEEAGHGDAVHLMTSRSLVNHTLARADAGMINATCLATVGLSNAGRVGEAVDHAAPVGTINLLVHIDAPLSPAARIEALSIATAARTAAVMDLGLRRDGHLVTGTGTDCIVVASPAGAPQIPYAGLHTDAGLALGRAVYRAIRKGGLGWLAERPTWPPR